MIYGLAVLLPSVALWIDGQRISAFLNLIVCGVSVYYALTMSLLVPLLAGPAHALVLIHLNSAVRFGRRRAATPAGISPPRRKGRGGTG